MAARGCNTCRQEMHRTRPSLHSHKPLIVQPARAKLLHGPTIRCNAAAVGQSNAAEESHVHDQQSHQQQQRLPQLTQPPNRKQLVRPAYAVATDTSARADAASVAETNGNSTAYLDSIQQAAAAVVAGQPSHTVIDVDEDHASTSSSSSLPDIAIKTASTTAELKAVADLRAEAYYADDHSRFAQSFKRQFAAQEVESLRQRTAPTSSSGRAQLCECLVALASGSSCQVLGCIDIRLPHQATGMRCIGVPEGDSAGCYLLNVVVSEGHRGQGIGKQLMKAAMARAVHQWESERLYTHVEADNDVASGLYGSCGFKEHSSEAKYANASTLGRLVLLMATTADAPALEETLWMPTGSQ